MSVVQGETTYIESIDRGREHYHRCGHCKTAVGGQDRFCRLCGFMFMETRKV